MQKNFSIEHVRQLSKDARVLTESLGADAPKIVNNWSKVGLLEGLNEVDQLKVARLLENQAVEILRGQSAPIVLQEANAITTGAGGLTSSGQITGFTSVAFPIVRKVFAGLVANKVINVQPMSLPSGLLFYIDFVHGRNVGGNAGLGLSDGATAATYAKDTSIYGGQVGARILSGSNRQGGPYDLVNGAFTKPHVRALTLIAATDSVGAWVSGSTWTAAATVASSADFVGYNARFVDFHPQVDNDVANSVLDYCFVHISASEFTSKITGCDLRAVEQLDIYGVGGAPGGATSWGANYQGGLGVLNLRRNNKRGNWNPITGLFERDEIGGSHIQFVVALSNTGAVPTLGNATTNAVSASAAITDSLSVDSNTGSTVVLPDFETDFAVGSATSPQIPDVNIRIEQVSVTTTTKKLKAQWTPEMAQDINAYFAIDIEAELTNLLSELVTLEIDNEILNDLLKEAAAANFYWSMTPGQFVNKYTATEGLRSGTLSSGPAFTGTPQDWYQTLMQTISDAANQIYVKTLRGSGNFIVTSPDVCTILEHMTTYKASYKIDSDGQVSEEMNVGAEPVGSLNGRYKVYKTPYFPRTKILIGYKGPSFLESGYIYAPYVPLILTPVVYNPDDFRPSKGLMTRYGKKMVRADFFATVTVLGMNLI